MSLPPPTDNYIGEPQYPSPWTTTKPREGLRDTDAARICSLAPDVCKTPIGSSTPPIPYPVVDYCGHDIGYAESVRFTGQKAMVFRSMTSHVHGDAPGKALGVKSGTVGKRCHPIEHAKWVRAEGSHVIRHLDKFWMNDRNTRGEAVFVRDTKSYAAPEDNDPVPGSLKLTDGSAISPSFGPPSQLAMSSLSAAANAATATGVPSSAGTKTTTNSPSVTVPFWLRAGIWAVNEIKRDMSMSDAAKATEIRALNTIFSSYGQQAIIDQKLLGGRTPITSVGEMSRVFSPSEWQGKYGLFVGSDERIPLANDILSAAAGRPIDVRAITDEEARQILASASEKKSAAKAEPKAAVVSNVRVSSKQACDDICKIACECLRDRGNSRTYTDCVARKLRNEHYDQSGPKHPDGSPRYPKSTDANGPRPEVSYDPKTGYQPQPSTTKQGMPSSHWIFKGSPRPDISWWSSGKLSKLFELKFPTAGGGVDGKTAMQANGEYENIAEANGLDPKKDVIEIDVGEDCDCQNGKAKPSLSARC